MEKFNSAITIESKPTRSLAIMAERTSKFPGNLGDQVKIVDLWDYKKAARCLAEAFMEDDVARYFVHTDPHGFQGKSAFQDVAFPVQQRDDFGNFEPIQTTRVSL